MPGLIGAAPDSVMWTRTSSVSSNPAMTAAVPIAIVVGPVYFLYGGASVWTLVR
jgi:hypothetical protein